MTTPHWHQECHITHSFSRIVFHWEKSWKWDLFFLKPYYTIKCFTVFRGERKSLIWNKDPIFHVVKKGKVYLLFGYDKDTVCSQCSVNKCLELCTFFYAVLFQEISNNWKMLSGDTTFKWDRKFWQATPSTQTIFHKRLCLWK